MHDLNRRIAKLENDFKELQKRFDEFVKFRTVTATTEGGGLEPGGGDNPGEPPPPPPPPPPNP